MATQSPKIVISELGQEDIVRDLTLEEIAEIDAVTEANKKQREIEAKAKAAKETAKAEVLEKLGLTEEEAKALLG